MPQSSRRVLPAVLSALALTGVLTTAAAESAGDLALTAGRAAWSRQDAAAAVTALSRATLLLDAAREPAATARAYFYLGLAYLDSGMAEEALVALERSSELGGGGASRGEIRRWQAVAAASLGRREAAEAYRQRALASEVAPAPTPAVAPVAAPPPAAAPTAGSAAVPAPAAVTPPVATPAPTAPAPQESAFEHLFGKRPKADPAKPPA